MTLHKKEARRIALALQKHHPVNKTNKVVYWSALLILVLCNLAVSFFLIPLLLVAKPGFVFIVASILGFIFGLLFSFIVHNIEDLEHKYHIFAVIFVPMLAVINMYIVVTIANNLDKIFKINIHQNPFIVAALYVLFFVIPYFVEEVKRLPK